MKKIDIHQHMLPEVYREFMARGSHPTSSGNPIGTWKPQTTLDLMDQHRIDYSVLSISESGVYFGNAEATKNVCRASNEYAAELIQKWPSRFGAFGVLPLPDVDASLREIEHSLDVLKLDGFIVHTNIEGKYLGDQIFEPVIRELNRRKAVIYLHPIAPPWYESAATKIPSYIVDTVSDTTRTVTSMLWNGTFKRNPDMSWILAHGGGTLPFIMRRLGMMAYSSQGKDNVPMGVDHYLRSLYYDTGLVGGSALEFLMHEVPDSQILFGTDFPFAPVPFIQSFIEEFDTVATAHKNLVKWQYENTTRLLPRIAALFEGSKAA